MKDIKVYICSPYTNGDKEKNVEFQMEMADQLISLGFFPFTPLYYHFQHTYIPRYDSDWLKLDFVWLRLCDCIIRFKTIYEGKVLDSHGSDLEEEEARRIGIPVFYTIDDMVNYYKENII